MRWVRRAGVRELRDRGQWWREGRRCRTNESRSIEFELAEEERREENRRRADSRAPCSYWRESCRSTRAL